MRINPFIYGILVITVFFSIILGFQTAGIWSISGKVDSSGAAISPSTGDVNTIKGWMTLEQITTTFNVPLADLLKQFDLPADTPAKTVIKDFESDTFDTTALKTWLQSRTQPVNPSPVQTATSPPIQSVTPTPNLVLAVTPTATLHAAPAETITGKTTFQDVLSWGVPKENIQKVLGEDMPAPSTVIKDYVTGKGLEFVTIKTLLQAEVDQQKP